jgi:hypothetical protein
MRWSFISCMTGIFCGLVMMLAVVSTAWAGPCFKCKHEPVVLPISLAQGTTVRTSEFLVKNIEYHIAIRVNRGQYSFNELSCLIGGNVGHPSKCAMVHWENVIGVEWKVLDGEHIVAQGTAADSGNSGNIAWSDNSMDRYLGVFTGEANKKYVVEVKFIKDGTSLKELNPRLVVRMVDF